MLVSLLNTIIFAISAAGACTTMDNLMSNSPQQPGCHVIYTPMFKIHAVLEQVQVQLLTTTKLKQQAWETWRIHPAFNGITTQGVTPVTQRLLGRVHRAAFHPWPSLDVSEVCFPVLWDVRLA